MNTLELSAIWIQRREMRDDAGATTMTKDAFARSFHEKAVTAEGAVEDVTGRNEELTVLLAIEGEVLTCPLVRVHGRSMGDTVTEVTSWRKGDQVEVTGKLVWPDFPSELRIEILTAAKVVTTS